MPKKSYTAEQIVTLLRQVEVAVGQGKFVPIACREASISDVSYYRRRAFQRLLLLQPRPEVDE